MVRIRVGSKSGSSGKPTGLFGRIGATLFFGIFLAMGLFFCGLLVSETAKTIDTYGWTETPCTIDHASVGTAGSDDAPYGLNVAFNYTVEGREYRSDRYAIQPETGDDYETLARIADALVTDPSPTCFVNPDDPSEAVLTQSAPWMSLFILIPLVFVCVGGGGIYFTWFGRSAKSKRAASKLGTARKSDNAWVGYVVLGIFALVGVIMAWFLTFKPISLYIESAGWVDTPCVIESSTLRSHDSDDGTTYSVDILFRYEVDGRTYRSNRHDVFAVGSSSGRDGKLEFVHRYPRGSRQTCLVDPDDPYQAVLERGLSLWALLTLLPLVFLGIGFGGLYATAKSSNRKRRKAKGPVGERRAVDAEDEHAGFDWLPASPYEPGPVRLKPTLGRFGKLVGVIIFAVFWNGIISVFLVQVVKSHMRGDPEWLLTLIMLPFVLVGLAIIGGVIHQLLGLINARVVLTVSNAVVTPGEELEVSWDLVGSVSRVRRLRIVLEGREEATYTRGTNTVTDKHTFAEFDVVDTDDPARIDTGRSLLTLPRSAVHSFEASKNKIKWEIKVHGEIRMWPDIKSEYAMIVRPLDPHADGHGGAR